jgi:CheY-like chemotaxis protein
MSAEKSYNFDLPTLLRLGDLDVRKVARNNVSLRVKDYFKILSKFIDHAPQAIEGLNMIARKSDDFDFQSMVHVKDMLEDIGCFKFIPAIDDIIKAGKRHNNDFAADCAKKFSDDLSGLHTRIVAAKETEPSADDPDADNPDHKNYTASYETHSLGKVLKLLEHEEATRKMRILAIDDAPVILKTISSILNDEYKVYGMTNPAMLEKFLRQVTPELFLLDYKMPELSGFDLVPIIRGFEEHKDTPIIFLTSMGTIDHVSAAFALGACDFIVKPFQGNILREKIAKYIVRKKLF